jgi:hypothetical protein
MSRSTGAYSLWVTLVATDFLNGQWTNTDWLTCLLGGKKGDNEFKKIEIPVFSNDQLREKFHASVPEALALYELAVAYEHGYTAFVRDKSRQLRALGQLVNIDNYLEWFEKASQLREQLEATEAQHESIQQSVHQIRSQLLKEDVVLVHNLYVAVTKLTFTA